MKGRLIFFAAAFSFWSACANDSCCAEGTFANPVIPRDWPDPAFWRGGDGVFYSVSTGLKTILASTNLVLWADLGRCPVTAKAREKLLSISSNWWAPCVKRIGGKWLLYISHYNSDADCSVSVLLSDEDAGPFDFIRTIIDGKSLGIENAIDPFVVESEGRVWMFFGSDQDGIHRIELTADGLSLKSGSPPVHVAGIRKKVPGKSQWGDPGCWEGSYLHFHGGKWYLFCSGGRYDIGNYHLVVGRADRIDGEFFDHEGNPMTKGLAKPILSSQAGDKFVGPGHNGEIFQAVDGREYVFYHAHDIAFRQKTDRPTLLQELKWASDGWPYFESGKPKCRERMPVVARIAFNGGGRRIVEDGDLVARRALFAARSTLTNDFRIVVHAVAEEVSLRTTFANPIDIEYRLRPETTGYDFREAADPEIVLKDGRYWLFASKCGGYFVSDDLIGWRFLTAKGLPFEEYAPTVETIGGKLNYSARGGTVDREIDAASGRWERIKGCMAHTCDTALFRDEDGRLYCYWASDPEGKRPISGCELDPVTFADLTQPQSLMEEGVLRYGWEVRGHCNDRTDKPSYIEGPHMIRRESTYYLQYAGPGTEWDGYCDTALTGPSPLGPFARQRMNPFSFKPTGYVRGAGHGKTFSDKHGNWWHVTTCVIQGVNRRLVMFPVFFDVDGEMWCDTAFADWPIRVPDRKVSDPQGFRTGWMELTVGKCAAASSTSPGSKVEDALDRNARTGWSASGGQGETFQVDLGGLAVVRAVQIGFDDVGEKYHGRHPENAILFRVEASDDGLDWRTVVDRSENDREAEHPYFELAKPEKARHLRIVCLGLPKGQNFALREFRAFGSMDKGKPAVVHGLCALRDLGDRRHVSLFWMSVPDATGYLIRYGVNKKKMHLSYVTSGTSLEIRSLDAEENYVWSICGFNEAGFGSVGEGLF